MKLKNLILISVLFVMVLCVPASVGCPGDKKIKLKSVDFPGNHKEDGYWAALYCGSDGKVYAGLNTEGGGHAHFYIYDPQTGKMRHRADLAEFMGESGKGIKTHAKIHSKFCEDKDGNIYFATGNMGAGPDEVYPTSWEGGHWIKYDPRADTLTDLGLVAPHHGIYGMTIDKERGLLFGSCRGGYFRIHNIATGETINKGRVNLEPRTVCRTLVCDDEGNVYGTFDPDRIFKYDARSGRVVDLSVRLPSDPAIYPDGNRLIKRYMRSGFWDDVNKKMYGMEGGTSILFEYDPKVGDQGEIKALARLLPYQDSEEVRKGHYATLSLAFGKNRKVYYMPIGSMLPKDHKNYNEGKDFFTWAGQAYLLSYDLNTGEKECLGRVYTQTGEKVIGILNGPPSGGGATGLDGRIYFCGFTEEKDPELASRYLGGAGLGDTIGYPARLRLLIYKPEK